MSINLVKILSLDKFAEERSKENTMHSCNYFSALPEKLFLPSDKLSCKNENKINPSKIF
jgi:hypothetical protein